MAYDAMNKSCSPPKFCVGDVVVAEGKRWIVIYVRKHKSGVHRYDLASIEGDKMQKIPEYELVLM